MTFKLLIREKVAQIGEKEPIEEKDVVRFDCLETVKRDNKAGNVGENELCVRLNPASKVRELF